MSVGTGWLRAIGKRSYEIYLVQMLVVLGLMELIKHLTAAIPIPLWYLSMLFPSVVVGLALSRYYSEPMNHRLRGDRGIGGVPR